MADAEVNKSVTIFFMAYTITYYSAEVHIARVFFCTLVGRRIVMLHSFVKKTQKTPAHELKIAQNRMNEVKHEY